MGTWNVPTTGGVGRRAVLGDQVPTQLPERSYAMKDDREGDDDGEEEEEEKE